MTTEDASATSRRLADYIRQRRDELELTQAEAAELAGIGLSTFQKAEYGYDKEPRKHTREGIETAMRWARGSVRAILNGGEPTPLREDDNGGDPAATAPDDDRPKPTITTTDEAGNVIPGPATDGSGVDLAELHRNIKEVAEALRRIDERLNEQDRRPGVGDRM
jgi:transcriptional regulator with XRE-family HTH domain